jgi:hypothetical protein
MKKLIFVLLAFPALALANPPMQLSDISRALSTGDVESLGRYFDSSVELSILEQEDVYDRNGAMAAVRDFFTKNPPRSFNQVHQGSSKGNDAEYCIGNLSTANGTFRVYIYLQVTAGKYRIQELRFDEE